MSRLLRQALEESGFEVTVAENGLKGLRDAPGHDLLIVDVMMPFLNGFDMVRQLREQGNKVPVLFLTAKDEPVDRIKGLDIGADDYLGKPFDLNELLARVRAICRRLVEKKDVLTFDDLWMDLSTRKVRRGQRQIYLSNTEFALLKLLLTRAGESVSKATIYNELWDESMPRDPNLVQVYINYLRRKLEAGGEKRLVFTNHGKGYVLETREG